MKATFQFPKTKLVETLLVIALSASVLSAQTATKKTKKTTPGATPNSAPAPAPSNPNGDKLTPRGATGTTYTKVDADTFKESKKEAVIVAPGYRDSGLAQLKYTYNDAAELKEELERQGYTVHLVPTTEATSDGIREALSKEKTYLAETDQGTLLFAFMGHGFSDGEDKNYLMTYGANTSNMNKEALSVDEVEKLMKASGARRKMIFIDACRSVPGSRDAAEPRTYKGFMVAEGLSVLLATRAGSFSYEDPELSHGIFTYFLLKGLRGEAAGKDGYITFTDLSLYVQNNVSKYAERKEQAQSPHAFLKDVSGDFLIATAPPAKPEEVKPPATVDSQITTDTPIFKLLGGQPFFVVLNGNSLTLIDAKTGNPYAILTEDPSQIKNQAAVANRTLRWFAGSGPNNARIILVTEAHGTDVYQIQGRKGAPCPGDTACGHGTYQPLLGETPAQAASVTKKTDDYSGVACDTLPGRIQRVACKAKQMAESAKKNHVADDPHDKYKWETFDLTSAYKDPGQAQAQPANSGKKS